MSVGLVPTAPSSGITASKKGMARSAILGGWDREFAACGERKTSSGKKRQPPGVCLQASIWKEQVCLYNSRPPDLLRGLKFQRQGHVSPLPFEILAKTFLADRGSAHEEASSGSVLDITGCLPGLSSSRGLSLLVGPMSPLGEGGALFPPHCQSVEVEQRKRSKVGFYEFHKRWVRCHRCTLFRPSLLCSLPAAPHLSDKLP